MDEQRFRQSDNGYRNVDRNGFSESYCRQSTLAGLGIEVELAQLAAIEIPVCIIATVVAIVFYVIKDRKMIQKYYK